jgi:hypothetical protein
MSFAMALDDQLSSVGNTRPTPRIDSSPKRLIRHRGMATHPCRLVQPPKVMTTSSVKQALSAMAVVSRIMEV